MVELFSIKELPKEVKIKILKELGYGTDGIYVLDSNGKKHLDKYINEHVRIDNMFIYPGSTIILDNNEVSITNFLEEYGEVL